MSHPTIVSFPTWIERKSKSERAKLRLKHMLLTAALRKFGRASIHDIARECGYDHSSIFCAMKRGYMTEDMALAVEKVFGANELSHKHLVDPLSLDQVAA